MFHPGCYLSCPVWDSTCPVPFECYISSVPSVLFHLAFHNGFLLSCLPVLFHQSQRGSIANFRALLLKDDLPHFLLGFIQGVTKRCRLSWLTNRSKMRVGEGGVAGSQPMSTDVHRSPKKLWRYNSIFKLWFYNTVWFYFSAMRMERPQRCTERHPPAVPTMLTTELTPAVSFFITKSYLKCRNFYNYEKLFCGLTLSIRMHSNIGKK